MQEENIYFSNYSTTPRDVSSEGVLNFTDLPLGNESDSQYVPLETFIGLVLAFSSCFFIGISVIFKKLALKDLEAQGSTRAADGGFGYLRMPKWWLGIILMGSGELTNFVAYIFAPAILVTPLGVFSIVCTAALSPYFLKEKLNSIGKLGCLLVLVGCIIVTLCGPKDREVSTMEELQEQLLNLGFLIYSFIAVVTSLILMALVPRFGYKYVMLYITICSCFGSLSVMFCKGVGLAIKQTIGGNNEFDQWSTWVCIISLVACLLIETIYMQRALDLFNSSVFMSVNYVMFTSMVIIASSILYTEFSDIGWKNIVLTILGFIVNIAALYLLHLDKEQSNQEEIVDIDRCQDHDAETPLMIKNGDKFKNMEQKRSSPLSNINLSPSLFQDHKSSNKFLNFLKADPSLENSQYSNDEPQLSLCSQASDNLYSDRSSMSNNSSRDSLKEDYEAKSSQSINDDVRKSLCEVPLISKLHTTSKLESSISTKPPSNESYQENETNEFDKEVLNQTNDPIVDSVEITQLV